MLNRIIAMNEKYELPVNRVPTLNADVLDRLGKFKSILMKEVSEIDDIIAAICGLQHDDVDILTMIADINADITVHCHSESVRYGIPLDEVLQIVMDSNDTKLGADGKFLKGPNFVPPEPAIRKLLLEKMK